jgi:hypothetical protein
MDVGAQVTSSEFAGIGTVLRIYEDLAAVTADNLPATWFNVDDLHVMPPARVAERTAVIEAARAAQATNPGMRLGQLLVVAAGNAESSARLFHMSDADLANALLSMGRVER